MSKNVFYVEKRPEGGFAARKPGAERASYVKPTQAGTIAKIKQSVPGATIHVERVRYTEGGSPDKWRKP